MSQPKTRRPVLEFLVDLTAVNDLDYLLRVKRNVSTLSFSSLEELFRAASTLQSTLLSAWEEQRRAEALARAGGTPL